MSAVLGCTFGEAAKNKASRRIVQALIKECIDVCAAGNIKIEPVQGKDIVKLLDYNNHIKKSFSFFIIPIAIRKHARLNGSMLQDIEKNKKTEVDAINGVVGTFGRLALSDAPGLNIAGRFSGEKRTILKLDEVKPKLVLAKKTRIKEIGFEYSVSFDIEYQNERNGAALFSSRDAKFYIADPVEGKIGFSRDGYLNTFNYRFYPGEKAHVTISGNQSETKLYINGKLIETLDKQTIYHNEGGKDKMYYVRTLVFPLSRTGSFRSNVSNLEVVNYCK